MLKKILFFFLILFQNLTVLAADYGYEEEQEYIEQYYMWLAKQTPWEVSTMQRLGDTTTDFIRYIVEAVIQCFGMLQDFSLMSLIAIVIIDLTLFCIVFNGFHIDMAQIITKIVKYGMFVFLITNWSTFINEFLLGIAGSSICAFSGESEIPVGMTQPQMLLRYAVNSVTPALNYLASQRGTDYWLHLPTMLSIQILTWGVILSFVIMTAKIAMCYIQFYITSVISLVNLPFSICNPLKFAYKGSMSALIQCTLELLSMGFMISLAVLIFKQYPLKNLFPEGTTTLQMGVITTYVGYCQILSMIAYVVYKIPQQLSAMLAGSLGES